MKLIITLIVVAVLLALLRLAYSALKSWVGGNTQPVEATPYAKTPWPKPAMEILNAAQKFEDEAKQMEQKVEAGVAQVKTKTRKAAATAKADVTEVKNTVAKMRRKTA